MVRFGRPAAFERFSFWIEAIFEEGNSGALSTNEDVLKSGQNSLRRQLFQTPMAPSAPEKTNDQKDGASSTPFTLPSFYSVRRQTSRSSSDKPDLPRNQTPDEYLGVGGWEDCGLVLDASHGD